ncbi:MAG: hypothetical protein WAQ28_17225 [Bacteroidia bacterium]|jgi:hypothetical protein
MRKQAIFNEHKMMIILGIALLFSSTSSKLCGQEKLDKSGKQFSSEQWKKDTLGTKGYRMKMLSSFYALDSIEGRTKDWVIKTQENRTLYGMSL